MARQTKTTGQEGPRKTKTTVDTSTTAQRALLVVLGSMTERQFQKHVRDSLEARGWLVFVIPDMRRTRPGWPDILAVHPAQFSTLLAWELKTSTGRVRPEQQTVLQSLARVPGVYARVVRPADWARLKETLDVAPLPARTGPGGGDAEGET